MRTRTPSLPGILLAISTLTAACGGDGDLEPPEQRLHVYNWSDYIAEDTVELFEQETGVDVVYDVYDSNDVLEGKLLAGSSGYDVVVPSAAFLAEQLAAGIYQPLERPRLSNWSNLDGQLLEQLSAYDPGNAHGVPYMWGTTGIAYNVAKVTERLPGVEIDSWRIVFDPAVVAQLEDCGVTMLDAGDEIFEPAMIYLGLDPDSEDPDDLQQAVDLVAAVRPYLRYFHSSAYIDDLANGEACMAVAWSGDALQARGDAASGVDIRYVIPREGSTIWFDIMAIPADAPHPELAHRWMDFILRPEVAAAISNEVRYANANAAAFELVSAEIRDNPNIYPLPETMKLLAPILPKSAEFKRVRNRAWMQMKSGS